MGVCVSGVYSVSGVWVGVPDKLQVHTDCIVYNVPLSRLQASEDLSARLKGLLRHNRLQLEVCGL